jgi:hypothetical protein
MLRTNIHAPTMAKKTENFKTSNTAMAIKFVGLCTHTDIPTIAIKHVKGFSNEYLLNIKYYTQSQMSSFLWFTL